MKKCAWCTVNQRMQTYHDTEWGVPVYDDVKQFEFISLEVLQCGLNWNMMLEKREVFRKCFDSFDFKKVALYSADDVARIMGTDGMIKSIRKIEAIIHNAKIFIEIAEQYGSFSTYLWGLAGGKMHLYPDHADGNLPAKNSLSEKISAELKRRGMKFMGAITVYSHLQACGIVNDHDRNCFRYGQVMQNTDTITDRD